MDRKEEGAPAKQREGSAPTQKKAYVTPGLKRFGKLPEITGFTF